jgi:hypothetical protein
MPLNTWCPGGPMKTNEIIFRATVKAKKIKENSQQK